MSAWSRDYDAEDRQAIADSVVKALVEMNAGQQPVVMINPTINIQVNYASGGGATVNVNRTIDRDCQPTAEANGFIARLMK